MNKPVIKRSITLINQTWRPL